MGGGVSAVEASASAMEFIRVHLEPQSETEMIFNMIAFYPEAQQAFVKFLTEGYASTSMDFYNAVEALRSASAAMPDQDFSDECVNLCNYGYYSDFDLPPATKQHLIEAYKVDESVPIPRLQLLELFSTCQKLIVQSFTTMLPKFERSKQFAEYLFVTPQQGMGRIFGPDEHIDAKLLSAQKSRGKINHKGSNEDYHATTPKAQREEVLVVEKVSIIAKILVRALQYKYNVSLAITGREALEVLLQKRFDVVLISLELDDRDGIDVMKSFYQMDSYIQQLKGAKHSSEPVSEKFVRPMTLVLGMTSDKTSQVIRLALKEGFSEVLIKPFSLADFKKAKGERQRLMSLLHL
jgi:CheY-like chemotaxis protein